jgi:cell division protein FtsB
VNLRWAGERPARSLRRLVWPLAVAVTLGGMMFVFFLPARALLQQRADLRDAETRMRVLSTQNQELTAQVATLHTDAEIQRLARQQYGLVFPGEEAYAILPSPQPPAPAPTRATPTSHQRVLASRLLHDLVNFM